MIQTLYRILTQCSLPFVLRWGLCWHLYHAEIDSSKYGLHQQSKQIRHSTRVIRLYKRVRISNSNSQQPPPPNYSFITSWTLLRIIAFDNGIILLYKAQIRLDDNTFRINWGRIQSGSPYIKLHTRHVGWRKKKLVEKEKEKVVFPWANPHSPWFKVGSTVSPPPPQACIRMMSLLCWNSVAKNKAFYALYCLLVCNM